MKKIKKEKNNSENVRNTNKNINKNINFNDSKELIDLVYLSFDHSEDIVFVIKIENSKAKIFYANPSFFKTLSYTKNDLDHLKIEEIFENINLKKKENILKQLKDRKYIIISTSITGKDSTSFPISARVYLYSKNNINYVIVIATKIIDKNMLEYRKYISEFLVVNFQKETIDENIIDKVAESILIFFKANILFYYPSGIENDKNQFFYMKDSALVKTSKEEIIQPLEEIILDNLYLTKIKKEPIVLKKNRFNISERISKNDIFKSERFFSEITFNTAAIIPIYIENSLKALILIGTDRKEIFLEEINLIRFTFQGILIFKMNEIYLKELEYQKKCFNDLLDYSLEMHYRQYFPTRKLEYISKACYDITGFTEEEFKEDHALFWNRIYDEDKKHFINFKPDFQTALSNKQNYFEYRFIHKDGSIKWLSDLFVIIYDDNNQPLYIVGSIRDITKQKEDEKKLIEMEKQIAHSQKMEALGRFSSEISHDFNNILASIKGNTQLSLENIGNLKKYLKDSNESILKENLNEIEDNLKDNIQIIKKGLELTDRIKLFSQKKHSKSSLIEVNEAINSIKTIFNYSKGKEVKFEYKLMKEKIYIKMNKIQFDQVLMNLLVNAYDAIKQKGIITIKTDICSKNIEGKYNKNIEDQYKKNTENEGENKEKGYKREYIKITIKDTGCGIDKNDLPKIFEPFFTTKEEEGTGLGLSIVYSIIKQNDGYIEVDSKIHVGTSFYIYLPIEKREISDEKN